MDFSNQIIPVSESSGGTGAGLVTGSATQHHGSELGVSIEMNRFFGFENFQILSISSTYVVASFSADRFVGGETNGENISGKRTPYAQEVKVSSALTLESKSAFGLRFTIGYISEQYANILNTVEASTDGRNGLIPPYHLLDGGVQFNWSKYDTLFTLTAKNLTDERYIASRRPQGIRVGIGRFITAGVQVNFKEPLSSLRRENGTMLNLPIHSVKNGIRYSWFYCLWNNHSVVR